MANWYVSVDGTGTNPGTLAEPWDLGYALLNTTDVSGGDTIWVREGTYVYPDRSINSMGWPVGLVGSVGNRITVRPYNNERAILDGGITSYDASPPEHVIIRNFEVLVHEAVTGIRVTSDYSGSTQPLDMPWPWGGIEFRYGTDIHIVNNIIHDNMQGCGFWKPVSGDSEFYGNIDYENGWTGKDRSHGHGIYSQNTGHDGSFKWIINNMFFDGWGPSITAIYGSESADINNYELQYNIARGRHGMLYGGATGDHRVPLMSRNFQVGGENLDSNKRLHFRNNFCFRATYGIGYYQTDGTPVPVSGFIVVDNTTIMGRIGWVSPSGAEPWPGYVIASGNFQWREYHDTLTGSGYLDLDPKFTHPIDGDTAAPKPQDPLYTLNINTYDPDRAHVAICTFPKMATFDLPVSGFLSVGDKWSLKHPREFFGAPFASGVCAGNTISVPMESGYDFSVYPNVYEPSGTFGMYLLFNDGPASGTTVNNLSANVTLSVNSPTINIPNNWYVSVDGTGTNPGTLADPWDLGYALTNRSGISPGDTVWITAGTYVHPDRSYNTSGWMVALSGTLENPIKVRPYPDKFTRVTLDGGLRAHDVNFPEYVNIYNLEVMVSECAASDRFTLDYSGSNQPIIFDWPWGSINFEAGHGIKIINCISHDNLQGAGFWKSVTGNSEFYGNIVYNNGWYAKDRYHGHGIYSQNESSPNDYKWIENNMFLKGWGPSITAIFGSASAPNNNYEVNYNIAAGGIIHPSGDLPYPTENYNPNCRVPITFRKFLLGGLNPDANKNLHFSNNFGFVSTAGIGYGANGPSGVICNNNTMILGAITIISPATGVIETSGNFQWRDYHYPYIETEPSGFLATVPYDYDYATGEHALPAPNDSLYTLNINQYDTTRAHVAVAVLPKASTFALPVSNFLAVGERWSLRHPEKYYNGTFANGICSGSTITIPIESGTDFSIYPTECTPSGTFGVYLLFNDGPVTGTTVSNLSTNINLSVTSPVVNIPKNWYVSVDGTGTNPGTLVAPWDLGYALLNSTGVSPGDTIWILPGTYVYPTRVPQQYGWAFSLQGASGLQITVRPYNNGRVILDGGIQTSQVTPPNYVTIRNLEIIVSEVASGAERQTLDYSGTSHTAALYPTMIWPTGGVSLTSGSSIKFINNIVHHNMNGLNSWSTLGGNSEIYGNIIYQNGWEGKDRMHGHGMYMQHNATDGTYRWVVNNILFNGWGDHIVQAYGTSDVKINNIEFNKNIMTGCWVGGYEGAIQNWGPHRACSKCGREVLLGGANQDSNKNLHAHDNFLFKGSFKWGYAPATVSGMISDNNTLVMAHHTIVGSPLGTYYNDSFAWRDYAWSASASGYLESSPIETSGSTTVPIPQDPLIAFYPNIYDTDRAHVGIITLPKTATVDLPVTGFLSVGDRWSLKRPGEFWESPLAFGTCTGDTINIPVSGQDFSVYPNVYEPSGTFAMYLLFNDGPVTDITVSGLISNIDFSIISPTISISSTTVTINVLDDIIVADDITDQLVLDNVIFDGAEEVAPTVQTIRFIRGVTVVDSDTQKFIKGITYDGLEESGVTPPTVSTIRFINGVFLNIQSNTQRIIGGIIYDGTEEAPTTTVNIGKPTLDLQVESPIVSVASTVTNQLASINLTALGSSSLLNSLIFNNGTLSIVLEAMSPHASGLISATVDNLMCQLNISAMSPTVDLPLEFSTDFNRGAYNSDFLITVAALI